MCFRERLAIYVSSYIISEIAQANGQR